MTTTDKDIENQTLKLEQNVARLDELSQRLIAVLQTKKTVLPSCLSYPPDIYLTHADSAVFSGGACFGD